MGSISITCDRLTGIPATWPDFGLEGSNLKVKEEEMHLSDGQLLKELEVVGHLVAGEGEPVVPPSEGIFINRKKSEYKK